MSTKVFKRKDILWRAQIKSANPETSDGGMTWNAVISGSDPDRDKQWVNQDTLAEQWTKSYSLNPLLVYMHGWKSPIGYVTDYARGEDVSMASVYIGKDFSVPIEMGFSGVVINVNDLRRQVEQKILRSFSIAFDADEVHEEGAKFQRLDVTDWYETSLVTIPSYRRAQITNAAHDEAVEMLARFLGDQRLKDYYLTGPPTSQDVDQDPAVIAALELLNKRLHVVAGSDEFSEADLATLHQLENTVTRRIRV